MPKLLSIKAKHKQVLVAPILEDIDLSEFLSDKYNIEFDFHQTGSNFVMGNKHYKIKHHDEYSQAKKGMKYLEKIQKPSK